MKFYSLQDYIRFNEALPCAAEGCTKSRWKKGKYCRRHALRAAMTGDPFTKPTLAKRDYKQEYALVKEVLMRNTNHEGVRLVVQYIQNRMDRASRGENIPNAKCWWGLAVYDASPVEIIAKVGAIYILWVNKSHLLKSEVHLRFMAGKAPMSLTNQTALGIASRLYYFRHLGTELDDQFMGFFLGLARAALEMVDKRHERERKLREGFKVIQELPEGLST